MTNQQSTNPLDSLTKEQQEAVNVLFKEMLQDALAKHVEPFKAREEEYITRIQELEQANNEGQEEATVDTPSEEATSVDVTEDVQTLFNSMQLKINQINDAIKEAYANRDKEKAKELEKQRKELRTKTEKLNKKFPTAKLITNYMNSAAYQLRKSAQVTRKYGNSFVETAMDLVDEVTKGAFQVVDIAVDGSKKIVGTASNATRKLGHFSVEQAASVQEATADLIERKEK